MKLPRQHSRAACRLETSHSALLGKAMWVSVILFPALAAALSGDLDLFTIQAGTSTNPGTSVAPSSLLHCAARCVRMTSYCDGFSYGPDRNCTLYSSPPVQSHCVVSDPTPVDAGQDQGVNYVRKSMTRFPYCAPGWIAFDGSCYLHGEVPKQSRGMWNIGCPADKCSKPVSVNGDAELAFLLHHSSRPEVEEWIGPIRKTDTITHGTNPDGSDFATSMVPIVQEVDGNCMNLPPGRVTTKVSRGVCGSSFGAICESRQPPGLPTGCPDGWLVVDQRCYFFESSPMTFNAADTHCASLADGARIGHPHEAGLLEILRVFASSSDLAGPFWFGIHDAEGSGAWASLTGEVWNIGSWSLSSGGSKCVVFSPTTTITISADSCDQTHGAMCQVARKQDT